MHIVRPQHGAWTYTKCRLCYLGLQFKLQTLPAWVKLGLCTIAHEYLCVTQKAFKAFKINIHAHTYC